MKPVFTESNKRDGLRWCLAFVNKKTLEFHGMNEVFHLDEKWIYFSEAKRKNCLAVGEEEPQVNGKSKTLQTESYFSLCDRTSSFSKRNATAILMVR